MNRREFLNYSLLGGALALASGYALQFPNRTSSALAFQLKSFELEEATITDLQVGMKSGKFTARSLTEKYLERIKELDQQGPALHSILELNPDALSLADALDAERQAKGPRGPLHGIPVLIKGNLDTADKMATTAGSFALAGSIAPQDSFVAQKLRAAGAVILGKTNLSEWANFRSTHASSGWSSIGGQCRNPYVLDRCPSGSSSGSGVAVAANLAVVAMGTETDGSIVSPSSANSVVGIKPTVGLVSRSGIIPISHTQDTAGPMARTVTDAAILLSALTGIDPRDKVTQESQGKSFTDYTKFLDPNGLKGARIGVARKFFGFNKKADQLITSCLEEMKRLGAVLVDPVEIPNVQKLNDPEFEVLLYEFKADLAAYLANLGPKAPFHSLKEIIDFNNQNQDREMPYFGQELFVMSEAKGPLTTKAYLEALEKCRRFSRKEGIDALMSKERLDAIVAPTESPSWTIDLVNGDHYVGGCSTPAAVAGYPHITIPAGYAYGLPVGISFFGRAYSEPTLIKLAFALEQATHLRRPPKFLANIE